MPVLNATTKFYPVPNLVGGLNVFDSPLNVDDTELCNVRNCVYTDGILQPRMGSLLYANKPSGEIANPFQMLVATNSLGVDFLIACYGVNFYLYDTINAQWIKLNTGFTPATTGVFYGSTSWNNGKLDDRFYFGNGIDDTMKWQMSVSTVKITSASSDSTLTLNSAYSFPASGNLIAVDAGTPVVLPYTSIGKVYTATTIAFTSSNTITDSANGFVTAGFTIGDVITTVGTTKNFGDFTITNVAAGTLTVTETTVTEAAGTSFTLKAVNSTVFNLTGTVGQVIPAGSTVTVPIVDASAVPTGSVFTKSLGRLFVANAQGAENTLHYSVSGNPESFAISSTVSSGGFYTLYQGKGGILGMSDFGAYLVIEKIDTISQFTFNYASDNSGFVVSVIPVISGDGIGPTSQSEILKYMNKLYYPTIAEGIIAFDPVATGNGLSTGLEVISQKINSLVNESFNFSMSRTAGFNQKLYWLCSYSTTGVPLTVNNLVIVYDLIRAGENPTGSAWTIFNNWNAVDIKPVNGVLYYLSMSDGAVYQTNQGYQDVLANNVQPYTAYALTKRINLNSAATLFRPQYIYIEGLVSLNTTFYVTVYDNESGSLGTQSYVIAGNNPAIVTQFTAGLGRFMLGAPLLGGVDLATLPAQPQNLSFFRTYLELSQAFRDHNVQLAIFSVAAGSQWGITTFTVISQPENSIETALVLGPGSAPVVII